MTPDERYSLLRHPQYLCYWSTRFSTALAYQMLFAAVGWQIYDLSNVMASLLGVVPSVLFGGAAAVALLSIKIFPELWRVQRVIPENEERERAIR